MIKPKNPASSLYHIPVLASEVIDLLQPAPGRIFVDATLGGGGHSALLLQGGATVIGFDRDPEAITQATERLKFYSNFSALPLNFSRFEEGLKSLNVDLIDGLLLDLGVSSHQLDSSERGFSFKSSAPLDMRMDPHSGVSARELIDDIDEGELTSILLKFGEERYARSIARAIIRERDRNGGIDTTERLANIVSSAVPPHYRYGRINPATRTFQALRISVNEELGALEKILECFWRHIKVGGRIAVISYHSLEDRLVKHSFKSLLGKCTCPPNIPVCRCGNVGILKLVNRKPILPSESEISLNPRARSAKLRVAERI